MTKYTYLGQIQWEPNPYWDERQFSVRGWWALNRIYDPWPFRAARLVRHRLRVARSRVRDAAFVLRHGYLEE